MASVSVCMATYNGSEFVAAQISSILAQLDVDDELIVVDDASTDDTTEVITDIADPRIRLICSQVNRGYVKSFAEAMTLATGEYLFIADQDDIWRPGRVAEMVAALKSVQVVATNLSVLGRSGGIRVPYGQRDWHLRAADSQRYLRNIFALYIHNRPYYGSAMAIRRDALAGILPFPRMLTEQYDLWIGLYGNLAHSIRHLDIRSVEHRFHEKNDTPVWPRFPIFIWTRIRLLIATVILSQRIQRHNLKRRDNNG